MLPPALSLSDVTKSYTLLDGRRADVLRGVSFSLASSEVLAIVGRSGSGKSTLLHILCMFDEADSGDYEIDGHRVADISEGSRSRIRNAQFGFVFQQFHLLDRRSAVENVALPLIIRGVSRRRARDASCAMLDQVGLSDRYSSRPDQLSGGEQQRVAIARALVGSPSVILADEPTGALDVETGQDILGLLLSVAAQQAAAVVIVTHDLEIAAMATRRMRLASGMLTEI
jgi:putative ABC transport system ATP-binding protein